MFISVSSKQVSQQVRYSTSISRARGILTSSRHPGSLMKCNHKDLEKEM